MAIQRFECVQHDVVVRDDARTVRFEHVRLDQDRRAVSQRHITVGKPGREPASRPDTLGGVFGIRETKIRQHDVAVRLQSREQLREKVPVKPFDDWPSGDRMTIHRVRQIVLPIAAIGGVVVEVQVRPPTHSTSAARPASRRRRP